MRFINRGSTRCREVKKFVQIMHSKHKLRLIQYIATNQRNYIYIGMFRMNKDIVFKAAMCIHRAGTEKIQGQKIFVMLGSLTRYVMTIY